MEVSELLKHVHSVMGEIVYLGREAISYLDSVGVKYREWGDKLVAVRAKDLIEKGIISEKELEKFKLKLPTFSIKRKEEEKQKPKRPQGSKIEKQAIEKRLAYSELIKVLNSEDLRRMFIAEILKPDKKQQAQYLVKMPKYLKDKLKKQIALLNSLFNIEISFNTLVVTLLSIGSDILDEFLKEKSSEIYKQYIPDSSSE